jgi:hypothetical protein
MRNTSIQGIVAVALLTACSLEPVAAPTVVQRQVGANALPAFAKGATDTKSRANLVWADLVNVASPGAPENWQPAGIQGDNRNKYGVVGGLPSDEYQGAHCGVVAFIFNQSTNDSGDLKVDIDVGYTASMAQSCGPVRTHNFYLAGTSAAPTPIGGEFYAVSIWQLGPGESRLQGLAFATQGQLPNCKLWFDNAFPPANHVRVTRLPNLGGVRQWRVESQGSHIASCTVADKRGNSVPTGVSYYLPFSVLVTEVPYPFPTFP